MTSLAHDGERLGHEDTRGFPENPGGKCMSVSYSKYILRDSTAACKTQQKAFAFLPSIHGSAV